MIRKLTLVALGAVALSACNSEPEVVGGQPDGGPAVEHRDRGRHRAAVADDALDGARHLHVLGVGHAVADDRALQRHDRLLRRERVADLVLARLVADGDQHRAGEAALAGLARRGHSVVRKEETYSTLNFARPVGIRITPRGLEAGVEQYGAAAAAGY